MNYKNIIKEILNLPWEILDESKLEELMILSGYNALEFAESLRIALKVFPNNQGLQKMAKGELKTQNLDFEDYNKCEDHSGFLWYFIDKYDLKKNHLETIELGKEYYAKVSKLAESLRAISVISREHELHKIFSKIRRNQNWSSPVLNAFAYYLDKHIELDGQEGGHSNLVSEIKISEEVESYYKIRLELYQKLFSI